MDPGSSPYREDGEVQLSQIKDDDDATCSASSKGVFAYVEAKKHCELLSQRREMPQLPQLGQRTDDNDAIGSGHS